MSDNSSSTKIGSFSKAWLHPKYWATWMGLATLGLIAWLPWALQKSIAHLVSGLLYHLARRRKVITDTNVRHCFPERSEKEQKKLVRDIFYENVLGLFETGMTFFRSYRMLQANVTIEPEGQRQLQAAVLEGKGVLLIGAHYSTLDLGGVLFSFFFPVDVLYRPHNNPIFNAFLITARSRWANQVIPHQSMKKIVRAIRQGHIFWFPADQDYGLKHSVYAPFFGLQAATITTPQRLNKLTQSPVFMLGHHRVGQTQQYQLNLRPIEGFPFEDDVAAATAVNQAIETEIRRYPAQYMWVHRRFKNQPDGRDLYSA